MSDEELEKLRTEFQRLHERERKHAGTPVDSALEQARQATLDTRET